MGPLLAALRYELGDGHTYDYAEGTASCPIDPGLATYFLTNDDCFAYFDPSRPESFATALHHLAEFIEHEGPFDGIMAFSQGAQMAAALLARLQAHRPTGYPVRCAIFLSAATPDGAPILGPPTDEVEVPLQLPTAHIWGETDYSATSRMLSTMSRPEWCFPFVHSGGHEVPGGSSRRYGYARPRTAGFIAARGQAVRGDTSGLGGPKDKLHQGVVCQQTQRGTSPQIVRLP
ncbi:uncharacterized protein KD926_006262 [Aspergillus affinis]|uniref:uncharacterized protein n=1 Tax=Aspergillus affinis TaxID=1070780 RepID=UPI0022FF32A8|nr:uncharacterized protein KD926_006262 [Aspergillus affinis]KAI9041925.1 hypothetical protein KD926_006262 [Aspergillus affinis]